MPKKQTPESPADQAARFMQEAQKLIDAGELDPIEAARKFEQAVKRSNANPTNPAKGG